jgi:hypothetical protein
MEKHDDGNRRGENDQQLLQKVRFRHAQRIKTLGAVARSLSEKSFFS